MHTSIRKRAAALALAIIFGAAVPCRANSFTAWDVEAASQKVGTREKKPYAVMIYMNGSDLESEGGAATEDLIEILESGLDARNAHVIIFTGGTNRWQNDVVPANQCMVWEVEDGWLYEVAGVGQANMGNPGTLASFIEFGMKNYPADKYGLIMWDHGGGSIAGYGHDEKYLDSNLTLSDMRLAFEKAGLKENKLEFLGFDSCLMATVEMAVVASDYVRYLIASEDLEPNGGWDYSFLSVLNHNPSIDGRAMGVAVTDAFISYYGPDSDEILSLSVTDLSKAGDVMTAMGKLMSLCTNRLLTDRVTSFRTLASKRGRTKTFGEGSPRDNECDMVDIGDMATKLSDLFPAETAAVMSALDGSVVYSRHNSDTELKGLSTYYIYGGKSVGMPALETYASLNMDAEYTTYLRSFFNELTGRSTSARGRSRSTVAQSNSIEEWSGADTVMWQPVKGSTKRYRLIGVANGTGVSGENMLWPKINGQSVCLNPVNRSAQNELYAVPAEIDGRDCDIMVLFNERYPQGVITGARNNEGIVIQKGYDPIEPGDKIVIYYMERDFSGNQADQWKKGRAFTVGEGLNLTWEAPDGKNSFGLRMTDIRNDVYYTEPQAYGVGYALVAS